MRQGLLYIIRNKKNVPVAIHSEADFEDFFRAGRFSLNEGQFFNIDCKYPFVPQRNATSQAKTQKNPVALTPSIVNGQH